MARWQLRELGLSERVIEYRVERARLHAEHRGVYAVGHRARTRHAVLMAAVLAGGPGAVVSHLAAAAGWRLVTNLPTLIHVCAPRRRRHCRGVRYHRVDLPIDETTVHEGIPITTVPRTLFDIAAVLTPRQLERALNEADVLRLWDALSLKDLLARYPRRRGNRALRAALEARLAGATVTRSELEEVFIGFVDELALPRPELNVTLQLGADAVEVDALWRSERIVVELDGRRFHDTPLAFERDRHRDRRLVAHGWRPVRLTWRQLEAGRHELAEDLRRLVRRSTLAA